LRVTVPAGTASEVSLGFVTLHMMPPRRVTIAGTVRGAVSRQPLEGVAVTFHGHPTAHTDRDGTFRLPGVLARAGDSLTFRRIGYAPLTIDFWPPEADTAVNLAVRLQPIPVRLGPVIVEGERATPQWRWIEEFEQRRKMGFGRFLTWDRIEKVAAFSAIDLLRWAGAWIYGDPLSPRGARVQLFGTSSRCGNPGFFIDGVRYSHQTAMLMLEVLGPEQIGGVEVYAHPGGLPIRYWTEEVTCGVVLFWTKR
jgi:hypothetical protein